MADEEKHSKKYKIEGTDQYYYADASTFPGKDSITKEELESQSRELQQKAIAKYQAEDNEISASLKEQTAQNIAKAESMQIEDARAKVEREWHTDKPEPAASNSDSGYHSLFRDTSNINTHTAENKSQHAMSESNAVSFKSDAPKAAALAPIPKLEMTESQKGSGMPKQMNTFSMGISQPKPQMDMIPTSGVVSSPAKTIPAPGQNTVVGIIPGAFESTVYGQNTSATITHHAGREITQSKAIAETGMQATASAVGRLANTATNTVTNAAKSGNESTGVQISDSIANKTVNKAKGVISVTADVVQDGVHKAAEGMRGAAAPHADAVFSNNQKAPDVRKVDTKGSVKPSNKTADNADVKSGKPNSKRGPLTEKEKDKKLDEFRNKKIKDKDSNGKASKFGKKPSSKGQDKSGLNMEGGMIKERSAKKAEPGEKGVRVASGTPASEKAVKKSGGTTKIGKDKPNTNKVSTAGKDSDKLRRVSENAKKKNSKNTGKSKKSLEKQKKKDFAKKNNNARGKAKKIEQAAQNGKHATKAAKSSKFPKSLIIKLIMLLIFIAIFMLDAVIIALFGGSGGIAMPLQDVKTVIQPTIDDLYRLEKAYMENLVHYGENPDYDYAGIPSTWYLSDSNGHDFSGVEHYIGDKRAGYDLLKYHANVTYISENTVTAYKTEPQTRATGSTVPGPDGKPIPELVSFTTIVPYSATATLTAPGDFNGDFGTFNALNATSSAIGDDSTVDISYSFYGSPSMNEYSDSKASSFIDGDGNTVNYDNGVLFKNIISMASAFCGDENEDYEFYHAYCKSLFNAVMDKATITIVAKDSEDENRTVTWTYHDDLGNADSACRAKGVKTIVSVNIRINDCGIQDLMALDPVTDEWAHDTANGGSKHYKVTDPENPKYIKWEGWKDDEKNLTGSAEMAIIYASLSDNDWTKLSGEGGTGVQFPGGVVGSLTASQITDIISEISNTQALSDKQEKILRVGLGYVGACHYLLGGSNISSAIDCSHFVCLVLGESGTTIPYPINYGDTDTLENRYKDESFWHSMNKSDIEDWKKLPVGTVLVKGNGASAQTHTNHTVIYAGVFTAPGETEPAPHFIESTNSRGASGPQIGNRPLSYYARYEYARNPF